jgi:hypothetical protein
MKINLVEFLEDSLFKSVRGESKITRDILNIDGMSSPKGRHLLNNLCSSSDVNFLEIGSYEGSTSVAALYENKINYTIIDNFKLGLQHKEVLINNFVKHLGYTPNLIDEDCFSINPKNMGIENVNLYFYDGEHEEIDQYQAITHYYDSLSDEFIYVVDDTNYPPVLMGTFRAIHDKNLKIKWHRTLFATHNGDHDNYWNGMYVAVLSKT